MDTELMARIPGAAGLAEWFGRVPRFHDANVEDFMLGMDGCGRIRLHGFRMTDKVDERGYFVLERHFVATFSFHGATRVELSDFQPGQAILSDFEIVTHEDGFEIIMESSYGFCGVLRVQSLSVEFQPKSPP